QPFMVMELMRGGDLDAMLQAIPDHILPIDQAVSIAAQTCQGLEFAHSLGVIHRDIRPGNILLTGDGTVKLGDFGFAVPASQSEISQDGLVVANAEYMAPEQASGAQAVAQSDLYSLGVTLYEMVTGRPPYLGERAMAIIEQHLNSTPVPPTRHNSLVPSELETLILRLLAKDISQRPESATEALNDLDSIASALRLDSADVGAGQTGRDPRYLRTFVGREPELRRLQSTFDDALTGHGAVVMVAGEMGIGKTTLCEQLATYATVRGGQSLTGHCFEEGLSSLPYIPFSEILRAYASTVDTETLKQQVGANAGDIARVVPEIGHELGVGPSAASDPDEDRYRLMRAVSNFLQNIAASQPLLVVLEDLHDADSSTLEMLNYLAHNVAGSRLMLVGTYRHTEITRSHPLSNVLVQLRRVNEFTSLQLRGLGNSEVHRMLTNIVDRDVPWSLAETICQQTEGNPLFVQEVIRDLVEEGAILNEQDPESTSVARAVAINIPQGLRDVISRRLSRLSPECNHALSIAAVIGREFRLDVLHRMLDMSEDEMYAALEEAQSVAVIQEISGTGPIVSFRFNHSFFRQTLYEDLFTPRRIRLHRQIGEILEDVYTGVIERHAREISEHFSHSSDLETLHKALRYTRMAAEDAISMSAYGEAVRLFTHALDIQEMVSPGEEAERCRLLLALGNAMISAGDPLRTAEETAPEALKLAQSLDDNDLASQSCELALEGLWRYGTALMLGTHQYRNWAQLADTYATQKSPARVNADIAMAGVRASEGRASEGRASEEWMLRHDALAMARDLDDAEVLFRAVYACLWPGPQQQQSLKLALAAEFAHHPRTGVSSRTLGLFLWRCGCVFLDSGKRPEAERAWQEMSDLAVQTGDAFASLWKLAAEATLALFDGRHEDAVALGTTMGATAEDLGAEVFGRQWRQFLTSRPLIHLGRAGEAIETSAETSGEARSGSPEPG
ncbi:MAG: protein kinase, partial [Chloroflexi bacterium]|nr:protein kinase [Chloroflexota bacterium]